MNIPKGTKLYYPSARKWMWNYCTYLGPYTDSRGKNYDLGIFIDEDINYKSISAAVVYGNEPGNYLSGTLQRFGITNEIYIETIKRAKEKKLF